MNLLIKLSWRNIWRNKRRSIFTLSAVVFAVYLAIAQRGLQLGTYNLNIQNVVELYSGYTQIQAPHYKDNPALKTNFTLSRDKVDQIRSIPEVKGLTKRIVADGLVYFGNKSAGVSLVGLNPEQEKTVSVLPESLAEGTFFHKESANGVVIGVKLLKNLGAHIGDSITIMSQGLDSRVKNQNFIISGTFRLGIPELESNVAIISLKSAEQLLAMDGKINFMALKLDQLNHSKKVKDRLNKILDGSDLKVLSWDELNPELKQAIAIDNISGLMLLVILFIIVAFGILNTILMSITERYREFGVALAVGMPHKNLVAMIFLETMFIAILGLIIGNVLGYATNYYFTQNPLSLGAEAQQLTELYHFLPQMRSTLDPGVFFHVSLSVFIISIAACIYPAWKIYRLEPLKGIRHT